MNKFLAKLALSAALTPIIKGGVALFQSSIAWWLAALVALGIVFVGEWLLNSDGGLL